MYIDELQMGEGHGRRPSLFVCWTMGWRTMGQGHHLTLADEGRGQQDGAPCAVRDGGKRDFGRYG